MLKIHKYLNQNYEIIKETCLKNGTLFEDSTFPADDTSIFKKNKLQDTNGATVFWKRPTEFMDNPRFIIDSVDPLDLTQGRLGNW